MPFGKLRLFFAFLYGASLVGAATGFAGRRPRGGRKDGKIGRKQHEFLSDRGGLRIQEKAPHETAAKVSPLRPGSVSEPAAQEQHTPRFAAGADQRTPAAASDLSAAAAEFSGLVFTAAIADGRAHAPCGIVLTEAKVKETGSWPHRKTVDAARLFHRSRASAPRKGSGNGTICQRVKCAHLNTITTSKEIYIYGYHSK